MDDDLSERVREEAETHALYNALKHGSDPEVGAIMGPLMGENPEFREYGDEVAGVVAPVVVGRVVWYHWHGATSLSVVVHDPT